MVADIAKLCLEPVATEGWKVLGCGLNTAVDLFGSRLVAAYAIGSLAHGGFAPEASDVDLALVLNRVDDGTEVEIRRIQNDVQLELNTKLAQRLSVFWSSWDDLAQRTGAGRFPLADQEDLIRHGLVLLGQDRRTVITLPDAAQMRVALVIESARFMIDKLAVPQRDALLRHPKLLVAKGVREATKTVLFPVRFLFTADVGCAAGNPESVAHFLERHAGPVRDLVSAAFEWRQSGRFGSEPDSLRRLSEGLPHLYRELTSVYQQVLETHGQPGLANEMKLWWKRIATQ